MRLKVTLTGFYLLRTVQQTDKSPELHYLQQTSVAKTKAALRGEGVSASFLPERTCGETPRGGRAPCRASVSADLVRVTNLLQEDTELSGSDGLSVGVKGREVTTASSEKSHSPPWGLSDKSGVGD